MTSKRIGILAGSALAGALLLGTAGLVAAQDPTATPNPTAGSGMTGGAGMMGGQMGAGMGGDMTSSSGVTGGGMMGDQMGAGMMGDTTGPGMMGGQMGTGTMTSDQQEQVDQLHDQMVASETCDQAQMQELHAQHHPSN